MQADTRRFFSAALLLGAVFSAVYLRVAYPPPPEIKPERQWGAPRMMLPDSVVYDFLGGLVTQADSVPPNPFTEKNAEYWFSRVLFEHAPLRIDYSRVSDTNIHYQYGRESAWILRHLYAERILSVADTVFMQQQIVQSTGFRLDPRFLPGCRIVPTDTLSRQARQRSVPEAGSNSALNYLRGKYQTRFISSLSAPLFSLNGRYAMTTITLSIGAFCGVGNTTLVVMEKKKGRWHKLKVINR